MIRCLLLDFDGVIRLWDEEQTKLIEQAYSIAAGAIAAVGLKGELIEQVTTGEISKAEWLDAVSAKIGSAQAINAWANRRVIIDERFVKLIGVLRGLGVRVCLASNGTNELHSELDALNLGSTFDQVFNSAQLRVAKPEPSFFGMVVECLQLSPQDIAFVDDSVGNISAASTAGILAFHYLTFGSMLEWLLSLEPRFSDLRSLFNSEELH